MPDTEDIPTGAETGDPGPADRAPDPETLDPHTLDPQTPEHQSGNQTAEQAQQHATPDDGTLETTPTTAHRAGRFDPDRPDSA